MTNPSNPLAGIGGAERPAESLPESLFRERMKNMRAGGAEGVGISEKEYFVGTAAWVADNLWKYPPVSYEQISQTMYSYLSGRTKGSIPHDEAMGTIVGEWVQRALRTQHENEHNRKFLVWCSDQLIAVGLLGKVDRIQKKIQSYLSEPMPEEDFLAACRVKAMDARDRVKSARGHS